MLVSNTRVTAQVGSINLGVCAFKDGGQIEADETKYRKGSMEPEESLGGPVSVENVTIRKLFDPQMRSLFHALAAGTGKVGMTVTSQPLDADGNPEGRAQVYRGILTRVTPPTSDSNSTDAAEMELEMSSHGT